MKRMCLIPKDDGGETIYFDNLKAISSKMHFSYRQVRYAFHTGRPIGGFYIDEAIDFDDEDDDDTS